MNTGSPLLSPDNTFPEVEDRVYYAVRAIILWLQGVFRTRPKGSYRWDIDPEASEIIITAHDPYEADRTNKRPNIVVSRTQMTNANTSIGQTLVPGFGSDSTTYTDLMQGNIIITVIAREGLEAQNIAYSLFRLIPVFRGMLNRTGRMTTLPGRMSMTPEVPYVDVSASSTAPYRRAVSVILPISIQDHFSIDAGQHYAFLHTVEMYVNEVLEAKFTSTEPGF